MRTLIIIAGGVALLGMFVVVLRGMGAGIAQPIVVAAKSFLPVWLVVALINMWLGVSRAGYSIGEELPIFLLIFAVPGALAAFLWWKFS